MVRRLVYLLLAVVGLPGLATLVSSPASAQQTTQVGSCRILPGTRGATGRNVGGARVIFVGTPRLACEGGVRINADSLTWFESTGFNQLIGNVDFEDADRRLTSDNARYFERVGRLEASGDVELTDKASGNVVQGENLLYLRQGSMRREEELTVWGGRARALLYPGAGGNAPASERGEPYDVTADRIFLRGESFVQASGRVEALRDSLRAEGDTLRYDQGRERILLTRDAQLDQEAYDLFGDEILLVLPGDTIRRVEARGQGRLVGEDLDLDAPFIRMAFTAGELDALHATPLRPGQELEMLVGLRILPQELDSAQLVRPFALSSTFQIGADSLEVLSPGQVLERMVAVGRARAVSSARDSINTADTPELIRKDWMEGDTVTATFASRPVVGAADSTEYVLDRLEARGEAASLYRLEADSTAAEAPADSLPVPGAPADSALAVADSTTVPGAPDAPDPATQVIRPGARPAVHYVTAREILIQFVEGQVERMEVRGLKQGVHLDPSRPGRPRVAADRAPGSPGATPDDAGAGGDPDADPGSSAAGGAP